MNGCYFWVDLNLLKNRLSWYYVNDYLQNTTEEQITNLKLLDLLFALNAIYFNKPLDSIKL